MDHSGWRVLIIEDDSDIRQLMGLVLRQLWHCAVVEVQDDPEAAALARDTQFDVIFLDLGIALYARSGGPEIRSEIRSCPRGSVGDLLGSGPALGSARRRCAGLHR